MVASNEIKKIVISNLTRSMVFRYHKIIILKYKKSITVKIMWNSLRWQIICGITIIQDRCYKRRPKVYGSKMMPRRPNINNLIHEHLNFIVPISDYEPEGTKS